MVFVLIRIENADSNRLSKWLDRNFHVGLDFLSFRMFIKYESKHQNEIADEEPRLVVSTSESCSVPCRLLNAAVRVNDLLSDVESRAVALDTNSDCFRSVASHVCQLSDVISHLMRLNQRLAWFLWRSIASLIHELMEHILAADIIEPDVTGNDRTISFSTLPIKWQQWQFVNRSVKDDELLENNGEHL